MREHLRGAAFIFRILFARYPAQTILAVAVSAVTYVAEPLAAYWLKLLIDAALAGDSSGAAWAGAALGVTFTLSSSADLLGRMISGLLMERAAIDMDRQLIGLTVGIPGIEHHERSDYIDQLELLRAERGSLTTAMKSVVSAVGLGVRIVAVALLLASVDPVLLLLPLLGIPSLLLVPKAHAIHHRMWQQTAERSRLGEHLYGLLRWPNTAKEVRIFGGQDRLQAMEQRLWREVSNERIAADVRASAIQLIGSIVFLVGYLAVIVFVTVRAINGQATVGDTLMAVALGGQVSGVAGETQRLFFNGLMSLRAAGRYLWLIDYADQASRRPDRPAAMPARIIHGLRLEHVTFRYPGTDIDILRDIDLEIPAGSTVAIVGENGAGKTTLVKLLARFYEPTTGRITLDGTDINRFDVVEWRARLAAGFQDFMRFEFIARESVGVGDLPQIDDEPAVTAGLHRAHAADVLQSLSEGLTTPLGRTNTNGAELSTGQWQKLALARAMMREHPLLLFLDEPTASLDAHTEHALFERYAGAARLTSQRTGAITILVSHRFSTVRMADLIIVLKDHQVTEYGSHEDLMANNDLYAELFTIQATAYQ